MKLSVAKILTPVLLGSLCLTANAQSPNAYTNDAGTGPAVAGKDHIKLAEAISSGTNKVDTVHGVMADPTINSTVRLGPPTELFDLSKAPNVTYPPRPVHYVNNAPTALYAQVGGCGINAATLSVFSNTPDDAVSRSQLMGGLCDPGSRRVNTYAQSDSGTVYSQVTTSPPVYTDIAPRFGVTTPRADNWGSVGAYYPSVDLRAQLATQNASDGATVSQRMYAGMWLAAPVTINGVTHYWSGMVTGWAADFSVIYVDYWSIADDTSATAASYKANPATFTGSVGYGTVSAAPASVIIGWISNYSAYGAYVFCQPGSSWNICGGGEWNIVNSTQAPTDSIQDPVDQLPFADGSHISGGGTYGISGQYTAYGLANYNFYGYGGKYASFIDKPGKGFTTGGAQPYGDGFASIRLQGWGFVLRQATDGGVPGLAVAGMTAEDGGVHGNTYYFHSVLMPTTAPYSAKAAPVPTPAATISVAATASTPKNGGALTWLLGSLGIVDKTNSYGAVITPIGTNPPGATGSTTTIAASSGAGLANNLALTGSQGGDVFLGQSGSNVRFGGGAKLLNLTFANLPPCAALETGWLVYVTDGVNTGIGDTAGSGHGVPAQCNGNGTWAAMPGAAVTH